MSHILSYRQTKCPKCSDDIQQDVDPLIPLPALPARLGIKSTRTIYRWIDRGILPKPVNINGRNYLRTSKVEEAERRLDGADADKGGAA